LYAFQRRTESPALGNCRSDGAGFIAKRLIALECSPNNKLKIGVEKGSSNDEGDGNDKGNRAEYLDQLFSRTNFRSPPRPSIINSRMLDRRNPGWCIKRVNMLSCRISSFTQWPKANAPASPKNQRRISLSIPTTCHPCWHNTRAHSDPIRPPDPVTTAIFFLVMSSESKTRKPELINCGKSFNHSGYVSFHSAVQLGWARNSSLLG